MEDEKPTQDFICICTPTFVTSNTRENAKLQCWSLIDMHLYYFFSLRDRDILDFFMQSAWNETQFNLLGHRYFSCVSFGNQNRARRRTPRNHAWQICHIFRGNVPRTAPRVRG